MMRTTLETMNMISYGRAQTKEMLWYLRKPAIVDKGIIELLLSVHDPIAERSVQTRAARAMDLHDDIFGWNLHPFVTTFMAVYELDPRDEAHAKTMLTDVEFMEAWTSACPWLLAGLEGLTIEKNDEWIGIIQEAMKATSGAVLVFTPPWYREWVTDLLENNTPSLRE